MLNCSKWRKLVSLSWLRMDPPKRLHVLKIGVLRTLVRKCDVLVASDLRDENDRSDLLNLRILRWTDTIHVPCNLDAKI